MKFDLAALVRRPSKRSITLPPIVTTKAQADDLARMYLRVITVWREAAPVILASYERTLEQALVTDSIDETAGVIDDIADAVQRLVLQLTPGMRDWAFRVEGWHRNKWARAILSAADIAIDTLIGPLEVQETVEAVIRRNTSLIKDVSEQIRQRIADSVFRGFQARKPARDVAREIAEAASIGRKRALRIASDQTVKIASALDAERQRQAGLDHWKWRHSHKLHFRPEHKARDGKIYTDETAPEDLPGELPYCGCVRQGVIIFDD